ncbi:carbohydrate-binding protein [Streptomyces hebeiensis]
MTAGNNGASTPEDDDPFGYLYEDGQAGAGAGQRRQGGYGYPGPTSPGVPRTSYNQVRAVGERQYGQQQYQAPPQQAPYGQQQAYGQAPYGQQPNPHYAAPETQPGGVPGGGMPAASHGHGGGRGGSRGGPNTKVLLISAIAVVAVVVVGITAALLSNSDDQKDEATGGGSVPSASAGTTGEPSSEPSDDGGKDEKPANELPKQDAATLKLNPPAALGTDIKGAKGTGGAYVAFNGVGGAASWQVDVDKAGAYTMFITYSVPGKDAETSLTLNDQEPRKINMSNFAKASEGDWEKGWTRTYVYVNLQEGKNDLKISCEDGNRCEALLDQVSLKEGEVKG